MTLQPPSTRTTTGQGHEHRRGLFSFLLFLSYSSLICLSYFVVSLEAVKMGTNPTTENDDDDDYYEYYWIEEEVSMGKFHVVEIGTPPEDDPGPPKEMRKVKKKKSNSNNKNQKSASATTDSAAALKSTESSGDSITDNANSIDADVIYHDEDFDDDEVYSIYLSEDDDEEEDFYDQCGPHHIPVYYDFDITNVTLPTSEELGYAKYEEEFFTMLNGLNVDDWDVTLQQDAEMNYHLLFERDEDDFKTFPIPKMFNNLTELEIIDLALDYFDQQDEAWEASVHEENLKRGGSSSTATTSTGSSTSTDGDSSDGDSSSSISSSPTSTSSPKKPIPSTASTSSSQTLLTPRKKGRLPRLKAKVRRQREAKILYLFFKQIGGTKAMEVDGRWITNETVCNWYGVVCGLRGQHKAGMLGQRNPTPPPDDAVTAIQLNNLELNGTIPTELAMLEYLSQLILRNNKIHGSIPSTLAHASGLCVLDLSNNAMTGSIPALLSTKTRHMYQIHLNNNNFTGTLPRNMRAWKRLWLMDVSRNQFSGTVPKHFGMMTDLTILSMGDNLFSGSLPSDLFRITNLQILDVGTNLLTGNIPSGLSHFVHLHDLNLADNFLTGTFPSELMEIKGLHTALLSYNNFSGSLPANASWDHQKIGHLHMGHNQLNGTLPGALMAGTASSLSHLDISNNRFHGTIPTEIGLMTSLRTIDAMSNRLQGTLPTEMLQMNMNLRLNFTDNLITEPIPRMFCGEGAPTSNILYRDFGCDAVLCAPGTFNPSGHATLYSACRYCNTTPEGEENVLGRVKCNGTDYVHGDLDGDGIVSPREVLRLIFVDNIGRYWGPSYQTWADMSVPECELTGITCASEDKSIRKIDLSGANLCGSADRAQPGPLRFCQGIPSEIGLLTSLHSFQASRRQYLRGKIPTHFGRLTNLQTLDFSSCPSMEGSIPSELSRLTKLRNLFISHGPFKGTIPSGIFHLTELEKLHLTKNFLKGTLPNIIRTTNLRELMLSRNHISGSIPTQIGRLTKLDNFEGYGNDFTGQLPKELGKCTSLKRIDIFNNKLSGTLPSEIALNKRLQIFHAKSNRLSGTLPKEYGELPHIAWIDVSDNQLSGTIAEAFGQSRSLKDLRFSDNMIYDPLPRSLCENKHLNGGVTVHHGCSGVACPLGTYTDQGYATGRDEVGCKACPEGESTLYLGATKCRTFSTYDMLCMIYAVLDGRNTWPAHYAETWENASIPVCDWEGIRCSTEGEIIGMHLPKAPTRAPHRPHQMSTGPTNDTTTTTAASPTNATALGNETMPSVNATSNSTTDSANSTNVNNNNNNNTTTKKGKKNSDTSGR